MVCYDFACKLDLILLPLESNLGMAIPFGKVLYVSPIIRFCITHIDGRDL